MVAVSHGNVQCLQLLLDKGAHVNHQDKVNSSSLSCEWSISSKVYLISHPSFHPQ